jgi:hypothetical protein
MQHAAASIGLPVASLSNSSRSSNSSAEVHKPVALLVFAEHAREIVTSEVAIWLTQVGIHILNQQLYPHGSSGSHQVSY